MKNLFFVSDVSPSALNFASVTADSILESDERLICTDLICEGPVEGLVNKDGELLKYVGDSNNTQIENLILGKGVYYNSVPLIDTKLDKLNFVTLGFNIAYGEEFNSYTNEYASTIHRYNQKLYLNESSAYESKFPAYAPNGLYAFYTDYVNNKLTCVELNNNIAGDKNISNDFIKEVRTAFTENDTFNPSNLLNFLDSAKKECQEFNHKIKNKYCDQISIQIRADQLFETNKGDTVWGNAIFVIEISEDNSARRFFLICSVRGISRSGFVLDLPINLNLNNVTYNNYYVKVYALSSKVKPNVGTRFKGLSIATIVERVKQRGNFAYPFSSIVRSGVSSRHFGNDPERTFDLKLLKIKVPENYDPEIRETNGDWNGSFDSFLRWTDNPAWIFYDICTNARYGVGNGQIFEKDLNKWELYKISKYCDELVRIATPNKYYPDDFNIDVNDPNTLIISKIGGDSNVRSLEEVKAQYPPVFDLSSQYASNNGGFQNSIIYLYDLKNDVTEIDKVYKKIIWSVEDAGTCFKIKLINDFGPRKFFEKDTTGLFQAFCDSEVIAIDKSASISTRIQNSKKNTESNAKSFILNAFANAKRTFNSSYDSYINARIIDETYYIDDEDVNTFGIAGKCIPRSLNYRDPFEPRFTCNLLIDSETECLKLLNDIASVFRGLTYYKNNYITATIDVNKQVSYIFNNSNVKNGLFSYSSGSLDGNYTSVKVMYKDKYENYTEQVEIVEDSQLIRDYGIVIKEILGFGITSKDQARRIGQWQLLTNRFENQTVTFVTDLQGIILRPSDVIQIEDQYRNSSVLQGRVLSVNYDEKFVVIDRQLNLNLTGKKIKFLFDSVSKSPADLDLLELVSDSDIDSLQTNNVIELKIDRIENNSNRVYFDQAFNFNLFNRILPSSPFLIENDLYNQPVSLYKIISISESDNNEYSLFCIRHDPSKYKALTDNIFENKVDFVNNTIAYSNSDTLDEVDVSDISFYSTITYNISSLNSVALDYKFNEIQPSLIKSTTQSSDYWVLNIDFANLFAKIQQYGSDTGYERYSYYRYIVNVLNDSGGLLCKITLRNQSIKFTIKNNNIVNKNIFLGKFGASKVYLSGTAEIKLYLFDKENKIIEV